ncbi:MAG: hypothetical protein JXB19_03360 [Bacteroidales bacterium]|nr:hypothetical protein [Bacteroidales bacterium]
MGNQGSSGDGVRQAYAWAWAGEIREVRKVDVWTSRPSWPQGMDAPTDTQRVPGTMDWNLWIGHMPFRPYNPAYTPCNFRGWWDFGTGAFGDWQDESARNAREYAAPLVNHEYLYGFCLPDMPS